MAQLNDTLVSGDLRVTGTIHGTSTGNEPLLTGSRYFYWGGYNSANYKWEEGRSHGNILLGIGKTSAGTLLNNEYKTLFTGFGIDFRQPDKAILMWQSSYILTYGTPEGHADDSLSSWIYLWGTASRALTCSGAANSATNDSDGNVIKATYFKSSGNVSLVSGAATQIGTQNGVAVNLTLPAMYTHPTSSGNKHIPSGGSSGQFLGWDSNGTAKWVSNPNSDSNVAQSPDNTSASTNFELLFSATADNSAHTEGTKKSSRLCFQPSTGMIFVSGNAGLTAQNGSGQTWTKGLYTNVGLSLYKGSLSTTEPIVTLDDGGLYCKTAGVSVGGDITCANMTAGTVTANNFYGIATKAYQDENGNNLATAISLRFALQRNDNTQQAYNFNDFTATGIYQIYPSTSSTNSSDTGDRITLLVFNHNGRIHQLSLGYWLKIRGRNTGGTWTAWSRVNDSAFHF